MSGRATKEGPEGADSSDESGPRPVPGSSAPTPSSAPAAEASAAKASGTLERPAVKLPDELARVISEILEPLLQADGGGLQVLAHHADAGSLELRLTGAFRGDPSAVYVRASIVKPALEKAAGKELELIWVP